MEAATEMVETASDTAAGENMDIEEFRDIWLSTANEAFKEVGSDSTCSCCDLYSLTVIQPKLCGSRITAGGSLTVYYIDRRHSVDGPTKELLVGDDFLLYFRDHTLVAGTEFAGCRTH